MTANDIAQAIEDRKSVRDVANELVADRDMSHHAVALLVHEGIEQWKRQNRRRYVTDLVVSVICVAGAVAALIWISMAAQQQATDTGRDVTWRVPFAGAPFFYAFYRLRQAYRRFRKQAALSKYWANVMVVVQGRA